MTEFFKKIFNFYRDGFRDMTTGKYLWKIILLKLFVILIILNYFIYDKTMKTEFRSDQQKSDFVYENLKGK
jgi:uncharacterized membrane protein